MPKPRAMLASCPRVRGWAEEQAPWRSSRCPPRASADVATDRRVLGSYAAVRCQVMRNVSVASAKRGGPMKNQRATLEICGADLYHPAVAAKKLAVRPDMKNAVDKRLQGMEVRFDGRTLLIGTVMFAVRAPKPGPELDALAALVRKAVAGPGLRMTVVAVDKAILVPDDLLDPAVAGALVVRTDSYVNTDESMEDVGARVRSALVGAPPRVLPWVAHGAGDNTIITGADLDAADARVFWQRFIATAADDLKGRP